MINLKEISLFSTLADSEIKEISPYLSKVPCKKKEVIFSEGDPSEWLYVVAEGKVKITKLSQDGKEIILEVIQPRDFFGGIAVLKGFPYPANAVAMEDSTVLKISRSNLMRILDRFPSLMHCMALQLGERIEEIGQHRLLALVDSHLLKLFVENFDEHVRYTRAGDMRFFQSLGHYTDPCF